jgi:hypothetical protein
MGSTDDHSKGRRLSNLADTTSPQKLTVCEEVSSIAKISDFVHHALSNPSLAHQVMRYAPSNGVGVMDGLRAG